MDYKVKHGNTYIPLNSSANKSVITEATQSRKLCGDDTVKITLQSAEYINFAIGDTIDVFGTTYTINQLPTVKRNGERDYEYTLVFEGLQYALIDRVFLMPDNTEGNNLMFDLAGMLDVLEDNINRGNSGKQYKFVLDESLEETEYKNLSLTEKNCLQVLQQLCQEWDTEFTIVEESNQITINIGAAGTVFGVPFTYGRNGGIYNLNREKGATDVITRLFCYGGTQNLTWYRHNRLCLPSKTKNQSYVESAAAQQTYGIKEAVKNFDEIYPNRIGEVSSVSGCEYNEFIDTSMADTQNGGFDLNAKWPNTAAGYTEWRTIKGLEDTTQNRNIYDNDVVGTTRYLINGETAKIHFNTGALAGYEIDIHSYNHTTQKFVLQPLIDENNYDFPSKTNSTFRIAAGDKYVILGINLPESYKTQAENDLEDAAEDYFATVCTPQPKYSLEIDSLALQRIVAGLHSDGEREVFKVGDSVHITDTDTGVDADIRIDRFERDLIDTWKYKLTLTDEVTYTSQVKTLIELNQIKRVVQESGIADPNKIRRGWKDAEELYNMVFDTEGQIYGEKIQPLSIDTTMLKVGARSQQLTLQNVTFQPNYLGDPAKFEASAGFLVHLSIDESGPKTWTMSALSASSLSTGGLYLYARCSRSGNTGTWVLSNQAITFDSESGWYNFLIGTLGSVDSNTNTRTFSPTYGFSTINGRYIKTGRIQSADGNTLFDLDENKIKGNIVFEGSGGDIPIDQYISGEVGAAVEDIDFGGRNILKYSDKRILPLWETAASNGGTITVTKDVSVSEWSCNDAFRAVGNAGSTSALFGLINGITTASNISVSGQKYVFSIYIKNTGSNSISITPNGLGTGETVTAGAVTRVVILATGNGTNAPQFNFNAIAANATFDFIYWHPKIELGTVATDWTPAPEDTPVYNLKATCATAAGTSTKVIVCPELTREMLTDPNLRIKVKFDNANTASTFEFEFRNTASGSAIRPVSSASTNKVRLSYEGRTSSYSEVKCYWTAGQEIEFTYKGVESEYGGGTSVHFKMTDESQFNTAMAFTKAMQGMTTIAGGLILTQLIQAGSGASQAGMNGVEDNAVAFWAGNTIRNAQTWNAPVVIMRGGDAKFGVLRIDGQSGLLTMEESNVPRFRIQGYGLPTAPSGQALERSPNATADYSENGYTTMPAWTNSMPSGGTSGNSLKTGISNIHNGMLVAFKGEVTLTLSAPLPEGTDVYLIFKGNTLANFITHGETLVYTIDLNATRPRGYFSTSGSTGSISVLLSCSEPISFTISGLQYQWYHDAAQAVTVVGTDGMAVQVNSTNYFQTQEKTVNNTKVLQTTIKGQVDMPGVLWAGRIDSDGSIKGGKPDYACYGKSVTVLRESIGRYKLTLSGFTASPTVLATCLYNGTSNTKGCSASVYGYSSSTVWVRTFSDNTLTDMECHVVLFGKN